MCNLNKEEIAMTFGDVAKNLSLEQQMLYDGYDIPLEVLRNDIMTLVACYAKLEGRDLEGKAITMDINFVDREDVE